MSFVDQFSVKNALRPREFAITPNGQYLVAAYQDSKNVIVFKIEENGALTYITTLQPINTPVAVAFITLISTSGLSGNALTIANYLNSLGPSFDNLSPIFDSLDFLSTSELSKALNRINPARNTFTTFTSQNTQFEFSSLVSSRLSDQRMLRFSHPSKQAYATSANNWDEETHVADASERLILQKKKRAEKYTFWIGGIGQFGYERAQQQNPSFHLNSGGALVAFDYLGFDNALIGGGIGYAHNSIHEAQNAGEGSIDIYLATFYGIAYLSSFYFEGALFGAYDQFKNERHIFFPGYDQTAKSHHQGYQLTPHVGLGYDINSQQTVFEPFLAFDWAINFEEGYKEHGTTSLNMTIRHRNSSMLRSEAGLNVYQNLNFSWGIIAFREKISYVNKKLFGVGRLTAAVVGAPGFFTVEALGPAQNLVSPAFEFFVKGANGWFGSLSYEGEFGSRYLSNTIFGKLGKYF